MFNYSTVLLVSILFFQIWVTSMSKPNILILMADDLGIGDLGCFGNDTIRTPNIDQLAKEGVKLTQHISASSLCTPSRSAFLTGRYPIRSGMAATTERRVKAGPGTTGGLPTNETTFATLLQQQGYTTGIIGKWHQGLNCESDNDHCHHPLNNGFDYFYGDPFTLVNDCLSWEYSELEPGNNNPYYVQIVAIVLFILLVGKIIGLVSLKWKIIFIIILCGILYITYTFVHYLFLKSWNCLMFRNHEIIQQPLKLEDVAFRIVREAVSFIERNKNRPFLLFVSFLHVHTPCYSTSLFHGTSKHGLYGDNVEEMDWMVGNILAALNKEGLKNDTFTYFTSDNGGRIEIFQWGERLGGCNGKYKGGKGMGGWEGGIRVPGIVRWPGKIAPNTVLEEPTSLMDIYPTVVYLAGASVPQDRIIDGKNQIELLLRIVQHSAHEFMFHYCGTYLHAVRWHDKESGSLWKIHYVTPNFQPNGADGCYGKIMCPCSGDNVTHYNPPLVFDLLRDPSESTPLSPTSELHFDIIISQAEEAVREHQLTVTGVPNQLDLPSNQWEKNLQPCCGIFPFCCCNKETN
ncbi:arylsulfatase H-like [Protobothrops mucrosquamatus]|uniref:arylsulfatase H-like n=1 Tax=Protobothrops mucrosquamatus TaxID=103944 RepID=UPI000775EB44|nr:arylsulfatase H-like [Protobothrops mucrosquamatus]